MKGEIKLMFLFCLVVGGSMFVIIIPISMQSQEMDVTTEVWLNYNDDELFSKPNVHYSESTRMVVRGFPDFWNIKIVQSGVTAVYPDGSEEYYWVITNVDDMFYRVV